MCLVWSAYHILFRQPVKEIYAVLFHTNGGWHCTQNHSFRVNRTSNSACIISGMNTIGAKRVAFEPRCGPLGSTANRIASTFFVICVSKFGLVQAFTALPY